MRHLLLLAANAALAALALAILAVASAPPALAAEVAAEAAPWWAGALIEIFVAALAAPVSAVMVAYLWRLRAQLGLSIEDDARVRLEAIIENGLAEAARQLGKRVNPRAAAVVTVEEMTKAAHAEIVDGAASYLATHGADTLKRLGVSPDDRGTLDQIVSARLAKRSVSS